MSIGQQRTFMEVNYAAPDTLRAKSPHRPAFVFFYPQVKKIRGQIFYNEEAWRILSLEAAPPEKNKAAISDIGRLCSKWRALLDRIVSEMKGSGTAQDPSPIFIETIQSYRRRYTVKGIILSDGVSDAEKRERSYLFLMERMDPDGSHLSQVLRQLNLNRREQEIVRLLIRGFGNKEIAYALGLSLNTIKGYMKLLMGKLAVRSRVEIVSTLLTGKPCSTNPSHPLPQSPQVTSASRSMT